MPADRNDKTSRGRVRKVANSLSNAASNGVARAVQPSRRSERLRLMEERKGTPKSAPAEPEHAAEVTTSLPGLSSQNGRRGSAQLDQPESSGMPTTGGSGDALDTPVELENLARSSSTPTAIADDAPAPTTALAGQSTTPTAAVDTVNDAAPTKEPDAIPGAADKDTTNADEVNHGVGHPLTAENLAAHQAANDVASRVEASAATPTGAAAEHAGDEKTDDGKTVTDDDKTDDGTGPRMEIDYGPITKVEQLILGPHEPEKTIGFTNPPGWIGLRLKKMWSKEGDKVVWVNLVSPLLPRPREGTKSDLEHYCDFTKRRTTIDPLYAPEERGPSPLPRSCFTAEDWERELAAAATLQEDAHAQSLTAQDTINDEAPAPVASAAQPTGSLSTPASASTPRNQSNPATTTGSAHRQPTQSPRVPAGLTRGTTMTDISIPSTPLTAPLPNGPKVITIKRRSGNGWTVLDWMKGKTLDNALRAGWKFVMKRRRAPVKKAVYAAAKMALACGLGRPGVAINTARGRSVGSPNLKRKREGNSVGDERPSKKRKTD